MFKNIHKKYTKRINTWYALFSMLFAAMIITSRHIFNFDADISSIATVYVTDFHFVDFIAWACMVPAIYLLTELAAFLFTPIGTALFKERRNGRQSLLVLAGSFLLLLLLWFPYLPSYWPGGIYSDTVDSINMALGKTALDNHHPILYTLIWRFMFLITGAFSGEGEYGGLKLFTVAQTLLLAFVLSYFIYRCYRWGLHKAFLLFWLLAFAIYPLYPFYGISMWKDTLFSLTVFAFSLFLCHTFSDAGENTAHPGTAGQRAEANGGISLTQLAQYCLFTVLIIFLRNNGIYVAAFYSAAITLLCLRQRKTAVRIGTASFIILLISAIIQGPVYGRCGYNINKTTESLGIPLQQTAYIVSTDGVVTQEDEEVLTELMPMERWKELYNPIVADTIKFSPEFNRQYLEENGSEFMKTYFHLVVQNPVKAVKAYLLSTMGFWDIFESSSTAYICNMHFGNVEYFMSDYFDYYLHISFRNLVEPKNYLSAALFVWLLLGTVFTCLARHNKKGLIVLMPTLGIWLTIMAAVPVAFSFRYTYALFLCTPLYLIVSIKSFQNPAKDNCPCAAK